MPQILKLALPETATNWPCVVVQNVRMLCECQCEKQLLTGEVIESNSEVWKPGDQPVWPVVSLYWRAEVGGQKLAIVPTGTTVPNILARLEDLSPGQLN